MSPVEAIATTIKFFDRQKVCLIAWFPRAKGQIAATRSWLLVFSSLEAILIPWLAPQKGFDHLIQFDPGHKHFYMRCISDCPLTRMGI